MFNGSEAVTDANEWNCNTMLFLNQFKQTSVTSESENERMKIRESETSKCQKDSCGHRFMYATASPRAGQTANQCSRFQKHATGLTLSSNSKCATNAAPFADQAVSKLAVLLRNWTCWTTRCRCCYLPSRPLPALPSCAVGNLCKRYQLNQDLENQRTRHSGSEKA